MTGNVVLLGFAVVGVLGFALASSLAALGGFLGTPAGGRLVACCGRAGAAEHRGAPHLAVPDLTTMVLTMTLTGIAADIRTAGRPVVTRRLLAVGTMFLGAVGGLIVLHARLVWALAPVAALLAAVAMVLTVQLRHSAPWQTSQ